MLRVYTLPSKKWKPIPEDSGFQTVSAFKDQPFSEKIKCWGGGVEKHVPGRGKKKQQKDQPQKLNFFHISESETHLPVRAGASL